MNGVFWLMRCGVVESYDRKKVSKKLKKGLLKYKKKDEQFSMILKEIIDEMEYNDTVEIKCIGEVQVVLDNRTQTWDSKEKIRTLTFKGENAIRLNEIFFSDEEKSNRNKKKIMKRKYGFFVIDNDEKIKFEGIIVCMHEFLNDTIQVKRGFYDNRNGQYVQKDVLIVDYLKGTGMENFKQFLTKVATDRLKCGFQMPEMAITKDAMDFIEK